jgi:membrane protein
MKLMYFEGVSLRGIHGTSWKQFALELWQEINRHNMFYGSAALAFYFMFSLFPAMLFLLSLLPYLPIPDLYESIMGVLQEALPGEAYTMFAGTIREITQQESAGLLSVGALLTLWAASTGMYAIIQHLNFSYNVQDTRPYWKARLVATLLTIGFGLLIVSSFALIMVGKALTTWLTETVGLGGFLVFAVNAVRWTIISAALLASLAFTYYFGPNVKQKFMFVTPGSVLAAGLLVAASVGFRFYVDNFGSYNATYGSIGAVMIMMLWLNIMGVVILLGSEVNSLIEHHSPKGKAKGEKSEIGAKQMPIERQSLAPKTA